MAAFVGMKYVVMFGIIMHQDFCFILFVRELLQPTLRTVFERQR